MKIPEELRQSVIRSLPEVNEIGGRNPAEPGWLSFWKSE